MPDATGRFLVRVRRAPAAVARSASSARRPQHQIVALAFQPAANGPSTRQREFRRVFQRQPVAQIGEHRQALQGMKAVGALVADMQEQIDLGGRRFGSQIRNAQTGLSRQARLQLLFQRRLSVSSSAKVSAWFHWKRASICGRPSTARRPDAR